MSLETIYEAVLNGDAKTAGADTKAALEDNVPAADILRQACIPAMTEVGRLFEQGEKFVPEMLISARAMQAAMAILKPHLVDAGVETLGKVVIGTVAGDLHDIGKNLVSMMLEGAGFEIVDLGTDVSPDKFVEAVQENNPDIIGMSALLTTTMTAIGATIQALTEAGMRDKVKILVGGAPITQEFADKVGADGFAPDAGSAARVAKAVVGAA
ncbi:MAG: corrinoid protein [Anaerolineae bacterium]|nr:corrinoid protein [Anaerolineae bacterium]